ncbi:unnamed protein product [Ilex paraguariensis]|uniref:Uncharacterized protein n=1 Tax=Ilex paraguariensis TaxID=185542 RepID=A0ABC8S114_9AQUA
MEMSGRSSSGSDSSFDIDELLQFRTRCRELRKEKDILIESQPESFELIRRLELHVRTLSEARTEDKKRIQELERELSNCFQEIDYLQDQLNTRNTDMEDLEQKVGGLMEVLKRSNSERLCLMQELENQELELKNSTLCIRKLEESISSVALEYQCEIESMKLDLTALEQSCFEAKKLEEESAQEKASLNELIHDFECRIEDAHKVIECLDKENKELREKLQTYEMNVTVCCQKVAEQFQGMLGSNDPQSLSNKLEKDTRSACGNVLGPLLTRLKVVGASDADLKENMEKMSLQMHEYELLVRQLKDELSEEKLKAKEEAEDLAQEMVELRYQITSLLEEECKRRAFVEQISLQRIAELEAQIEKEQRKSFTEKDQRQGVIAARHIHEA